MYLKFNNIFKQEYISSIRNTMYTLFNERKLGLENTEYIKNSVGLIDIPETLSDINLLNEIVLDNYGSKYKFTHTYSRIYFNGANLSLHVDRAGLDLSCSLTVYHNLQKSWPLNFSRKKISDNPNYPSSLSIREKDQKVLQDSSFKQSFESVNIEPNEMIFFDGRDYPHWRDKLECERHQHSMHIFYHWKIND
jgi:hypothetical protein